MRYLLIILLLIPVWTLGQQGFEMEKEKEKQKDTIPKFHTQVSANIGIHYNLLTGNRYYPPHPTIEAGPPHAGTTFTSSIVPHAGCSYKRVHRRGYEFITGFSIFNRRDEYETSLDSIDKYVPDTMNAVSRKVMSHYNLEIPFLAGYQSKRISFLVGLKVATMAIFRTSRQYRNGAESSNSSFGLALGLFPAVQMKYTFNTSKKYPFSIYIAADVRDSKDWDSFDIQVGVEVLIKNSIDII